MKNIGITVWNDLVSPLFDASCTLRVIGTSEEDVLLDIRKKTLQEKADICKKAGIRTLICGAISHNAHSLLIDNGITVIGWIQGSVDEILMAFSSGETLVSRFAMPGCRQFHRHHCRRAGSGGRRHLQGGKSRGCGGIRKNEF